MGALTLGLILILGYYYLSNHPVRRLRFVRTSGYNIYFKAGVTGLALLTFSLILWIVADITSIVAFLYQKFCIERLIKALNTQNHIWELKAIIIFALAFVLAVVRIKFKSHGLRRNRDKMLEEVLKFADDAERTAILAISEIKPLRIVLESGKVYIGLPQMPDLEGGEVKHITMLPFLSGYTNESHNLTITNNYFHHYENYYEENGDSKPSAPGHSNIDDFAVVIPMKQITVFSYFDVEAYKSIDNHDGSL